MFSKQTMGRLCVWLGYMDTTLANAFGEGFMEQMNLDLESEVW